jgi:hypothetical protein
MGLWWEEQITKKFHFDIWRQRQNISVTVASLNHYVNDRIKFSVLYYRERNYGKQTQMLKLNEVFFLQVAVLPAFWILWPGGGGEKKEENQFTSLFSAQTL